MLSRNFYKKTISFWLLITFLSSFANAESVKLNVDSKQQLNLHPVAKVTKDSIIINDKDTLSDLIDYQHDEELKDLEILWQATIEKNNLIKFTLKKLNTPESQRRLHSSLMAKSVSAIVYGATFLPSFMGANPLVQSASFTSGRLANNFINKTNISQVQPLSDTELIELAGTIEELQDNIISTYYNYKGALNKLKDTREKMILYNKNYSNALKKGEDIEIIISSSLYDDLKIQEYQQEQNARKYYFELERLAGKEAVDKLNLAQFALKNQLVNPEAVKQ
ncbi:MAG: hypothetical protein PHV37_06735 [Candidatus Gastranaerophilales bacterium]|nr:hypothetical protein [Candidatus Gastranaerophilales bacterium]